ncbi:MAG TPA: prepilin-type N-terminal cleavage/methylation domain-containing protein [Patescibacteria group bacterium]|nr:prepilin-type N-terminal cleavage/methylation domain-containing protein [Patescibacteria group bacterium]
MNSKNGFTLIEIIIYVAILSIFIGGAIQFAWNVIYSRTKTLEYQNVTQNARLIVERISLEIRNASSINSIGASSISLASDDSSRNPTVIDLSGGRVQVGYGSSGSCPTSSPCFLTDSNINVSSLTFTNLSASYSANVRVVVVVGDTADRLEYRITDTATATAEIRKD